VEGKVTKINIFKLFAKDKSNRKAGAKTYLAGSVLESGQSMEFAIPIRDSKILAYLNKVHPRVPEKGE
jgi:hypothetical protein